MGKLRIVVITTGWSAALAGLLRSRHEIVGIVQNLARRGDGQAVPRQSALHSLASAGYGWIAGRGPSLEGEAARAGVAYHLMDRGSDDALEAWVRQREPDLIVVCAMVHLLKERIYSIPPLGAINLHPSLLPRFRGPDPYFWTYHEMERTGGVTVHFIDRGSDTGDVLVRESFPIPLGMPRPEYVRKTMGEIGPRLLEQSIDALASGEYERRPQPPVSPTPYARRVRPEEHRELIRWDSWPIDRVWHFLRGTEPWLYALDPPPGWREPLGWSVGALERSSSTGRPGAIERDADGYYVGHSEGRIRLSIRYSRGKLLRALVAGGIPSRRPRPVSSPSGR